MKLTDIFVRRPVLAIVVNLVIIIAGLPRTGTTHLHNLLAQDTVGVA